MNFRRTDALQRPVSSISNGMIKIITEPRRCSASVWNFQKTASKTVLEIENAR